MNLVVVQARMASKRLPGKAMLKIRDRPVIEYVLTRALQIQDVDKVVLATSVGVENDCLVKVAESMCVLTYRGDEENVLLRYYDITKGNSGNTIVRLTGDNPLIDIEAMSRLLKWHNQAGLDYSCYAGYPVGSVGDIFSKKALTESYLRADGELLKDHIDLYVLENQDDFNIKKFVLMPSMSNYRFTLDDIEDLVRLRKMFKILNQKRKLLRFSTAGLITEIKKNNMVELMTPKAANISKENEYTYQLCNKIKDKQEVNI